MRRIKLEQTRALRSAMERRQERRRFLLRLLAMLAILLLLLTGLAMFLMRHQRLRLTSAPAAARMVVSAHSTWYETGTDVMSISREAHNLGHGDIAVPPLAA